MTRSELRQLALTAEELAKHEELAQPVSIDDLVYSLFMGYDRTQLLQAQGQARDTAGTVLTQQAQAADPLLELSSLLQVSVALGFSVLGV